MQFNPTDTSIDLFQSAHRAGRLLGLTDSTFARTLGLSEIDVRQMARGAYALDPASSPGQLAVQLVHLYLALTALIGSDERQICRWMHSNNEALKSVPETRIQTPEGLAATLAYLSDMRQAS